LRSNERVCVTTFIPARRADTAEKRNMYLIYSEYLAILLFILVAVILSFILFGLSYLFIGRNPDIEKLSAYECGFNPFEDARTKFDVRFYIVAILFIVFDLEVTFLCP
jgi:NADH:ubiquinone oxidoreductase subunit 3 (subunit A)